MNYKCSNCAYYYDWDQHTKCPRCGYRNPYLAPRVHKNNKN